MPEGKQRRMPGEEGGDMGHTGRSAGGQQDRPVHVYEHHLNRVEESVVRQWDKDPREAERAERATLRAEQPDSDLLPTEEATGRAGREPIKQGEMAEQGRTAAKSNLGLGSKSRELPAQGSRGSQFKGEYYETHESVPDQRADQGEVPPESVIHASRNI